MKSNRFNPGKKMLAYGLLLAVLFVNSGAGCGGKGDDPQPDNFQSLLGKWEAQRFDYAITKQDGSALNLTEELKKNGTSLVWEFFSDGRLKATEGGNSREVRWELTVSQLDGKDINDGKLKVIGAEEKKLAELIGQSGDLTYDIGTSNANGLTILNLSVDVTKAGTYQKSILTYTYHKL